MTTISPPSTPGAKTATPYFRTGRTMYRSPITGAAQGSGRPADYWWLDVQLPPLSLTQAMTWRSRLIQALTTPMRFPVPEPGLTNASAGATVVSGGGQIGHTLNITGGTPGYVIAEGRLFSVVVNGRSELHMTTAAVTLNGSGAGALAHVPAVRGSPTNGVAVEFAAPVIEGLITDPGQGWNIDEARMHGFSFSITEL